MNRKKMEKVRCKCGFECEIEMDTDGSRGGLCLAWKEEVIVTLRSFCRTISMFWSNKILRR